MPLFGPLFLVPCFHQFTPPPLSLPSLLLILFSCLSSRDVHRVENTHTSAVHRDVAIGCSPNPSAHSQRPVSSCPHYNHRLCCFHTNIPVVHTRAFSHRTCHSEDVILKMFPNSYIDLFPPSSVGFAQSFARTAYCARMPVSAVYRVGQKTGPQDS